MLKIALIASMVTFGGLMVDKCTVNTAEVPFSVVELG